MYSFRLSALVCVLTLSCGILARDMPGNIKSVIEEALREAIEREDDHCQHITPLLSVETASLKSAFTTEKCEDLCPWCWLCVPKQDVEQCENYCESQCDFKYLEAPRNKRSMFDVCIEKDNKVDVKLAPLADGLVNVVGGLIDGGLGQITGALKDAGKLLAVDKLVGDVTGSVDGPLGGLGKILGTSSSAITEELVDGLKNGLLDKAAAPVVGSLSSIVGGLLKPSSTDSILETLTAGTSPNSVILDKVAEDVADSLLDKIQDTASGILSSVLQSGDQKNKLDSVVSGSALDTDITGSALVETVASKIADYVLGENTASAGLSIDVLKDVVNSDVADKMSPNILDINDNNEILKDAVKSAVSDKLATDLLDINDNPDLLDINDPGMLKEALTSAIADQLTAKILDQDATLTPKADDLLSSSKLFLKK